MARVSDDFISSYTSMMKEDLSKPIIFVVDMVNGFVKEGALHDEKINLITPHIIDLIEDREQRVIFIADAHPPKTREFNSYPSHCVIGTSESEIIDELKPYVDEVMKKNSTNTFTSPAFQEFIQNRIDDYQDIILTGCCTDICILQFALCLNAWLNEHNYMNHRIIIPIDCIDTYHIDQIHDSILNNEFSIKNMEGNGIHIVSTIERG